MMKEDITNTFAPTDVVGLDVDTYDATNHAIQYKQDSALSKPLLHEGVTLTAIAEATIDEPEVELDEPQSVTVKLDKISPVSDHVEHVDEDVSLLNDDSSTAIDEDEITEKLKAVRRRLDPSESAKRVIVEPGAYDLTVVTPTRNERDNVLPLLQILKKALDGVSVEVIFVDDSDDDTPRIVREAEYDLGSPLFHIRLEHRQKGPDRTGGLATAVDRGLRMAQAKYVAVIDADLQHPPEQLRVFYQEAIKQDVDLVLASRYIKGGGYGGLDGVSRLLFSVGLKWTAKILFPERLARVSDPLGGFFLLKRSLLDDVILRPIGYKILLEILIRCSWQSLVEVPYHFQQREHGQSKANMKQGIMALQHMMRLFREVPSAGRIWKCAGLVLLNLLCVLCVVLLANALPGMVQTLGLIACVLLGCLNFIVLNRFIFPVRPVPSQAQDMLVEDAFTEVLEPVPSAQSVLKKSFKGVVVGYISLFVIIAAIGWISLTLPGAWVVLAALFIGFSVIAHKNVTIQRMMVMVLGMLVGIASIDYLGWRFAMTNWSGWWIAIPLLFAETLGAIHTLGFQYTLWPRMQPKLRLTTDATRLPIFIFIPTVNEGTAILEPTLDGVMIARDRYLEKYPHGEVTIVLCNDGYVAKAACWQEVEKLAHKLGVTCVTRTVPGGAKAGNIEYARQQLKATDDSLLIIFDADQIAKPEFLLKTVPAFGDPSMGWVQTGQYYSNLENPVSRWADDQQAMFYHLLCPGKASLNAAFICGTNVVIRAKALDQIGGLPQDSVTEDFSASIALHPHWRSIFLTDVLATGMGPLDMPSYLKQQRRWAIGTLGVLRTHWRQIFLPQRNGLSLPQRVQYFLACTHYLCGLRDLIYLLCPMLFVLTTIPAVHGSTLTEFFWHFSPYLLASMASLWYAGRGLTGLRGIIIGFGCFPVLIESLLSVILQRKVGFSVTSKQRSDKQSLNYLTIYIVAMVAGLICFGLVLFSHGKEQAALFISGLWIVYSLFLLGSFLWLSVKDLRFHKATNHVVVPLQQSYHSRLKERETGLRPIGNLFAAVALACLAFIGSGIQLDTSTASPFVISGARTVAPLVGLSLPIQLLESRPALLEQKLATNFTIVGRTQDVRDSFDGQWTDRLLAHNEQPWITLEFGISEAPGKSPLDASLPAIANGLHDNDLQRWARSIRDYGKPVYLTILLHVDRNWALSSAVANGGIPQDAPRAWKHVQAVFQSEGAKNVAWVWAPADPAHDNVYAPPASTINAVLLSMISYPKTRWVNPANTLQAVVARYPNKPIIVEVSAAGNKNQKAAWLTSVGNAVAHTRDVYALIYHEGSPAINPTPADNAAWSILSDPSSALAWQHIVASLDKEKSSPRMVARRTA